MLLSQRRWQISLVLMLTVFVGYLDRLNISLALPLIADEFGWSVEQKRELGSWLMSLFYIAYGIANIFLTPFAARFGPRKALLGIITLWSVFTAMGAWFSQFMMLFQASRVLLGLSEGCHFPMMNALTKQWFPLGERSRANSLWIAGLFLAVLLAPVLLVPLMNGFGWRAGFYVLALGGLLISLPLVFIFIHDSPALHPNITEQEQTFIAQGIEQPGASEQEQALKPQYRQLLSDSSFWLMLAAGMLNNMVALGISNWLPSYFASRADVAYNQLSYLAALPYVFSLLGLLFWSQLGDRTNRRGHNAGVGFLLCGLCVYLAFSVDHLWFSVAAFSVGVFCIAAWNACEFAMVQRIFPATHIAAYTGVYNGLSTTVGGGIGTWFLGYFMADVSQHSDILPLMVLFVLVAIVIIILGRRTSY